MPVSFQSKPLIAASCLSHHHKYKVVPCNFHLIKMFAPHQAIKPKELPVWPNLDVLRIASEDRGLIGFIDVGENTTLHEARTLIKDNIENAPDDFQFLLSDGTLVGTRQESNHLTRSFQPCITLRINSKPKMKADKIIVKSIQGDSFISWVTETYTFGQLRRDAARFWNLPQSLVVLQDDDGCAWPEEATISSILCYRPKDQVHIILAYKPLHRGRGSGVGLGTGRGTGTKGGLLRHQRYSFSIKKTSVADILDNVMYQESDDGLVPRVIMSELELWYIFTYYCVHGDTLELEYMKAYQFSKLLRDCNLFGANLTPAMVDIIYTSEARGRPEASGKLNYDEFINALIRISTKVNLKSSNNETFNTISEEETNFHNLVTHILRYASRWCLSTWSIHTTQLRTPEAQNIFEMFSEPLTDIFMFYALNTKEKCGDFSGYSYLSYGEFMKMMQDFNFNGLQLTSKEFAEIFLASCNSPNFEINKKKTNRVHEGKPVMNEDHVMNKTRNPINRTRLCFSNFFDAIGRCGSVAIPRMYNTSSNEYIKAVLQHMSRSLNRSRVLHIFENRRASSTYPGALISGSMLFNTKFFEMWRLDGSPDYLTGKKIISLQRATSCSLIISSSKLKSKECHKNGQTLPLQFNISTFTTERELSGGGRGREMLNRLVDQLGYDHDNHVNKEKREEKKAIINVLSSNQGDQQELQQMLTSPNEMQLCCETTLKDKIEDPTSLTTNNGKLKIDFEIRQVEDEIAVSINNKSLLSRSASTIQVLQSTYSQLDEGNKEQKSPERTLKQCSSDNEKQSGGRFSPFKTVRNAVSGSNKPVSSITSVNNDIAKLKLDPMDKTIVEELSQACIQFLCKGGVFRKYGHWGSPHRRYVWCSEDLKRVQWRPLHKKSTPKEGLLIADIIDILPGNAPQVKMSFEKHNTDPNAINRCFSLITHERKLDLESDSETSRDEWMKHFRQLVNNQQKNYKIDESR